MDWQNIDVIYTEPKHPLKKSCRIRLTAHVEGEFDQLESNRLGMKSILKHWMC